MQPMVSDGEHQRQPVGEDVARRGRAHAEQGARPASTPRMSRVASRGSEVPVPPPSAFHCASSRRDDLGDHPGADGEIGALQAEDEEAGRDGEEQRGEAAEQDREHRVQPPAG